MSDAGREARDVMLGLMKTCMKLGVPFFAYLGDRLGLNPPARRSRPLAHLGASPPAAFAPKSAPVRFGGAPRCHTV